MRNLMTKSHRNLTLQGAPLVSYLTFLYPRHLTSSRYAGPAHRVAERRDVRPRNVTSKVTQHQLQGE